MFFKKEWFQNKALKKVEITRRNKFNYRKYLKFLVVFFSIFLVLYFWNNISYAVSSYVKNLTWKVVQIISKSASTKPQTDALWNTNILLLWVWWKWHNGSYLTDTMMVASFNSRLNTLTFLSVPRDLYVKYDKRRWWRINYIFAEEYLKTHSFDKAAEKLEWKLKQILWININYYVLVDFWWFEHFVDNLWWLTINVPETLIDYRYPWPNRTYTTFKITKGIHHIDWATALKYARSRHSTSDFSRSWRQEQIIRAIIHKLVSDWTLLSPTKLKNLYLQFQDTVKTDMSFGTILSFIPYVKQLKIHSYVLNWDCFYKNTTWKTLMPWCFVYPARRSDFNWQAVLLPVWADVNNIENYSEIRKFAFIVINYPELWLENAKIQILNWIWKTNIRRYYWYLKPIASKLAYELKNYGFNIQDVKNASKVFDKTTDFVYNKKPVTEQLLPNFVWDINFKTGDVKYTWSGYDMTLILWKNYLYNQVK